MTEKSDFYLLSEIFPSDEILIDRLCSLFLTNIKIHMINQSPPVNMLRIKCIMWLTFLLRPSITDESVWETMFQFDETSIFWTYWLRFSFMWDSFFYVYIWFNCNPSNNPKHDIRIQICAHVWIIASAPMCIYCARKLWAFPNEFLHNGGGINQK